MSEGDGAVRALDVLPQAIVYRSPRGDIRWMNESARNLPASLVNSFAPDRTCGRNNEMPKGELPDSRTICSPDGRVWKVQTSVDVDESGRIAGVIDLVDDVMEQWQELRELRGSEKEFRILVESAEAILWKYDIRSDEWTYVSPQTEDILGYRPEEWTDLQFWVDRVHAADREWAVDYCMECTAQGKNHTFEYRFMSKDGAVVWIRDKVKVEMSGNEPLALRGFMIDITERKRAEERYRYLSFRDELTGLYNRRFFREEVERLDTQRQIPVSIVMADVNGLKLVNDGFGHHRGDEILKLTANLLRESFRTEDIIARWGGDEFVILLPQTTRDTAESICCRVRSKCNQLAQEQEIPVSIALGTAVKERKDEDIFDILRQSEDWMYHNKLSVSTSARSAVLRALLNSLGAKSHETEEHALRLRRMALAVGEKIGLAPSERNRLSLLVSLHDIGKIGIAEHILTKPGELTEDEWEIMKRHPEVGYRIASATDEFAGVALDILYHHECWDGTGYPRGLQGEEIPILSRIVTIVDAYDAITSERPYSAASSSEEALEELKACAGSQFDPELVDVFVRLVREGRFE